MTNNSFHGFKVSSTGYVLCRQILGPMFDTIGSNLIELIIFNNEKQFGELIIIIF